jgi:hypothetical protein
LKTAAFTLRGSVEQGIRWKRAADAGGFTSVGAWAADALDAHLKHLARVGRPLPLAWRRGRLAVILEGGERVTVPGFVSPPFGAFRGTAEGRSVMGRHRYTLVHAPAARIIATLHSLRQCKALAAELAPALLRGELPDPAAVVERHQREAT